MEDINQILIDGLSIAQTKDFLDALGHVCIIGGIDHCFVKCNNEELNLVANINNSVGVLGIYAFTSMIIMQLQLLLMMKRNGIIFFITTHYRVMKKIFGIMNL